jgi:hypothetical protein
MQPILIEDAGLLIGDQQLELVPPISIPTRFLNILSIERAVVTNRYSRLFGVQKRDCALELVFGSLSLNDKDL